MSMRRAVHTDTNNADRLRTELEQLKHQQAHVAAAATGVADVGAPTEHDALTFDQLTPTEQAAGSLGVDPNAWRPIGFMNAAVSVVAPNPPKRNS